MTNEHQNPVEAGKKPRAQNRLPQGSYIQADDWMEYLGYEQYCWWLKFHSWVNRQKDRVTENHIPYTLEDIYKNRFKISKTTFYRKIKVLWEVGLIDFREFEESERKSQKPINIIVYEYPYNDARYEYLPLEKRRDWDKDYISAGKTAGKKGGKPKKEPVDKPVNNSPVSNVDNVDNHGFKNETVEKKDGFKIETVDGFKNETVTVSEMKPNHCSNNLITSTNNYNHLTNNSFLSLPVIQSIENILKKFNFKEGEIKDIIELISNRKIKGITCEEITSQAEYMSSRLDIVARPIYFVNGLERRIAEKWGVISGPNRPARIAVPKNLPFYNWLEE